jgi:hypothetical protein
MKRSSYYINKITIIIFLLTAFSMFYGCAATERTVQNNIFNSASPKWSVAINKDFYLLGSGASKYNLFYTSVGGEQVKQPAQNGRADVDFYVFIPKEAKDQKASKAVAILIHSMPFILPMKWAEPCLNVNNEKMRDYGMKLVGEENYEFATASLKWNSNSYIAKWLEQKNFSLPTCSLVKCFIRVDDLALKDDKKAKKELCYYEDAAISGFDCSKWEKMKELSDKQLKYLKGFEERASKAMQINSVHQE